MQTDTRDPAPGTDPSADQEERRHQLAQQVADRIQRELAGDLEVLRARLGLAPRTDPAQGAG